MILKLIPGQRINFTVAKTEEVQGNFGPQIKFTGETPDDADAVLFLNVDTAQRQLARIGYDTQSVIGRTVEFARTEKNGTKYTDINRVSTMPQPHSPPVATSGKAPYSSGGPLPFEQSETGAPPSSAVEVPTLDRVFHTYDVCFDHAYSVAHKKMGNDCTHEGIAAMAATLFIQAHKR
jgi:hypothetical protein